MVDFINPNTHVRVDSNGNNSPAELTQNFESQVKAAEGQAAKRGVEVKDGRLAVVVEKWGEKGPDRENTLSGIADLMSAKLGRQVTAQELAQINGISGPDYVIHPGDIIIGPAADGKGKLATASGAGTKETPANGAGANGGRTERTETKEETTPSLDELRKTRGPQIRDHFAKIEDKTKRYEALKHSLDAAKNDASRRVIIENYLLTFKPDEAGDEKTKLRNDYSNNQEVSQAISRVTVDFINTELPQNQGGQKIASNQPTSGAGTDETIPARIFRNMAEFSRVAFPLPGPWTSDATAGVDSNSGASNEDA